MSAKVQVTYRSVNAAVPQRGRDELAPPRWALDLAEDTTAMRVHLQPFVDAGRRIALVELYAGLGTRLDRNRTPYRLEEKKSKRDLEWSDANVRDLERYQMNTDRPSVADALIAEHPHLRLDNTDRTPEDVAAEILAWLDALA